MRDFTRLHFRRTIALLLLATCCKAVTVQPSQRLNLEEIAGASSEALIQIYAAHHDGNLIVSGSRPFPGQLKEVLYLPAQCGGSGRPLECSAGERLDFELQHDRPAHSAWSLGISMRSVAEQHSLQRVIVWYERCTDNDTPLQQQGSGVVVADVQIENNLPAADPAAGAVYLILSELEMLAPVEQPSTQAGRRKLQKEDKEEDDEGKQQQQSGAGCSLVLSDTVQAFDFCHPIAGMGGTFNIMWTMLPPSAPDSPPQLRMGLNGTVPGRGGYVAVGFPNEEGEMVDANAFILQSSPSASTGAKLQDYYMSGTTYSSVNAPSQLAASNYTAASLRLNGDNWIAGTFQVVLPPTVALNKANLIFAKGPVTGSSLVIHDYSGEAGVDFLSGTMFDFETERTKYGAKLAHGILMFLTWGVLIPLGILMAHSFHEFDPLWFKLHRGVQAASFLLALVGFGLGFAITGSWSTPFSVHRNLGMSVTVLGLVQVTALVYRPAKIAPTRLYWDWQHWWIGRAAAICAVANIYYGFVNVADLGVWAWACYTVINILIILIAVIKDGLDIKRGQRTFASLFVPNRTKPSEQPYRKEMELAEEAPLA